MIVLDASVLIAFAKNEPSKVDIAKLFPEACVSAINASEFIQKLNQYDVDGIKAFTKLEQIGLKLHSIDREDSYLAAKIYKITKPHGLSIADRFCLTLAIRLNATVYTADKSWLKVAKELELKIVCIR